MAELKNIYARKRAGDSSHRCFHAYIIMCMHEGKMRSFFSRVPGKERLSCASRLCIKSDLKTGLHYF